MIPPSEAEIRAQAAQALLKVEALDWLAQVAPKGEHPFTCPYMDDTGHPAPCTCGYNSKHRVADFIRRAILKA